MTRHAEVRCNQRGIQQDVVDAILKFGREHERNGAFVLFMDKAAHAKARKVLGKQYARIADRLNVYLIVGDDGSIVTAAQRMSRLKYH